MNRRLALSLAAVLVIGACTDQQDPSPTSPEPSFAKAGTKYVIVGANEALPANLDAQVAAAGGSLAGKHSEIGIAYAISASPAFRTKLAATAGIESVTPDRMIQWVGPVVVRENAAVEADVASAGDNETFFSFQWAPTAIQAPEAWNAGFTGQGVRVAILDGAIHSSHVDLAPNLDLPASRSFVPGFGPHQDVGTFWHGTHVAGIVAAADNGIGTIGIAPQATLIGVKVLHNGSGEFNWVTDGIMYAAKPAAEGGAGAQVINMSLGATLDEKDPETKAEVRELKKAVDRATKYAHKRGVTVIASSGNGATNFDVEKELFKTPAQNKHVISVAATGPVGWVFRGATNFDAPAYYTDFGKSLVDVAGPGGTAGLFVVEGIDAICSKTGTFVTITNFCEAFDMVLSTVRGGATATASYNWAQGTSMAAPAVSGIAALIIQRNGGSMKPDQVRTRLQKTSLDLGTPGKDEFYGHGWVNAFRAIQ